MATQITIDKGVAFIGRRWAVAIPVRDTDGAKLDISGFAMAFTIRSRVDGSVVGTVSTGAGGLTVEEDEEGVSCVAQAVFGPAAFLVVGVPIDEGWYDYALSRTDAGQEYVIAWDKIWMELTAIY